MFIKINIINFYKFALKSKIKEIKPSKSKDTMTSNCQAKEFYVEAILDKRVNLKGQVEYLIKWEDYSIEDATWEPIQNINDLKPLLEQYEKSKAIIQSANTNNNYVQENLLMEEILEFLDEDKIPLKILSMKMFENKLLCLCEFSESSTGIVPDPCYVPSTFLREKNAKILIDFYESKIKFVNRKWNINNFDLFIYLMQRII